MNSIRGIRRAARILVLIGLGLAGSGTLREAHAGGGGLPHIEAIMRSHDVSHCTSQGDNAVSCYTTTETSIRVDGIQFTRNGLAQVEIEDARTAVVDYFRTVQVGPKGDFWLGTGRQYCTRDGWLVRAYDSSLRMYANTVAIPPCGAL